MFDRNDATVIGAVSDTPELKFTAAGNSVANLRVLTEMNTGEKTYKTWHKIVAFGELAETVGRCVSQGDRVAVYGRLQTRSYDKEGVKHYITEIVARDITKSLLESKPAAPEEDIPF